MGEIVLSKMRHEFHLRGQSAHAAYAVREVMLAASKGVIGERVFSPLGVQVVQALLKPYAPQIQSALQLSIDDINAHLGLDKPVTQIYREPNGKFSAVSTFADIVGMSTQNEYVLYTPISYNGEHFTPNENDSRLLGPDDFIGSGEYPYLRGVGAIASPPVLMALPQDVPLPDDFDPNRHNWTQNPFARPQVAG